MTEEKKYTILIGAGGTGGHIFPAITLAKKFKADGHKVVIVGTGNALEKKIFAQYDIETIFCLLYTSPSPRDQRGSRMPSSA